MMMMMMIMMIGLCSSKPHMKVHEKKLGKVFFFFLKKTNMVDLMSTIGARAKINVKKMY